jgi:subtilisin family serine protease
MDRKALKFLAVIAAAILLQPLAMLPAMTNEGGGLADYMRQQQTRQQEVRPKRVAPKAEPQASPAQAARPSPSVTTVPSSRQTRRTIPRERAPSGLPPEGETRFLSDEVIVRYRLDARQGAMDALVRRLDLRHLEARTFALAGVTVHRYAIVGSAAVRDVIRALEADATVVYAQPNYLYRLQQAAAQGANPAQYALAKLSLLPAQDGKAGAGVSVAIIDSGVDTTHPDLEGRAIVPLDLLDDDAPKADAHGTTVAGLIVASGRLSGIAPDARLVAIRAFAPVGPDGTAQSTSWTIAAALDAAHQAGADIVNMSFAGPRDPLVEAAVRGAARRSMFMIAAAGNEGPEAPPLYPAAYEAVLAVTATDPEDAIYERAGRGSHVMIAAPGVAVLGPVPGGGYALSSGTSLAAAHISGLAALMQAQAGRVPPGEIERVLIETATDLGEQGRDPVYGAGLANGNAAIKTVAPLNASAR